MLYVVHLQFEFTVHRALTNRIYLAKHQKKGNREKRTIMASDKTYDAPDFVEVMRGFNVTPHVTNKKKGMAVDVRTTRHVNYRLSVKDSSVVPGALSDSVCLDRGWQKSDSSSTCCWLFQLGHDEKSHRPDIGETCSQSQNGMKKGTGQILGQRGRKNNLQSQSH